VRHPGFRALTVREKKSLQRRSQAEFQVGMKSNPLVKWIALAAGLALVVALGVDLTRQALKIRNQPVYPSGDDPAARTLGVRDRTYLDARGRFRITLPAAWVVLTGEEIAPFDIRFAGPDEMEVSVQISATPSNRPDLLLQRIRNIEEQYGVNMNIRTNQFKGFPSVERTTRMVGKTVRALDFIANGQAHHLQAAAQREQFDASEAFLDQLLQTYQPGPVGGGEPAARTGP
jgi:hypothetical protein